MPPATSPAEFEQIVLLSILRLDDGAYGTAIRQEISACTGRDPARGALCTTLERLEEKALMTSGFGDPTVCAADGRNDQFGAICKTNLPERKSEKRSHGAGRREA
jgi:hypothetical protein